MIKMLNLYGGENMLYAFYYPGFGSVPAPGVMCLRQRVKRIRKNKMLLSIRR